MNRSPFPHKAFFAGSIEFPIALLGGGGGANLTIPANGVLEDDAAGLYPKACNFAVSGTIGATGVYTIVYSETVKHLLFAHGIVVSDGTSPTAVLVADVTKLSPGDRTITVKISTPAGTLTDLGTSDLLILWCKAADTSSI